MGAPGWWCPGHGWWAQPQTALTPEQQQKLTELRQKFWQEAQTIWSQIFAKQQQLWDLYRQPSPDRQAIAKLQREIFELRQQLAQNRFSFWQEAQKLIPGLGLYGWGRWGRWGWHHMGPMWGGWHMGPGFWGHHMMGPYSGLPYWGF
jgi:hypothetical protein